MNTQRHLRDLLEHQTLVLRNHPDQEDQQHHGDLKTRDGGGRARPHLHYLLKRNGIGQAS